ncbi:acyltransferase [Cupriavidus plantarum]|uniref:acyltransferase n=1 Tax=Cupriavidus plantarum TaxID=942865 RepID=UPI000EAFA596|nr:acyltransferase family protein [Cupriavidus plantarum]NYH98096.1 surface polysaccharide O-acyltransferase-like enzyme [Cupriavidus plantarum]RLK35473.1 surface polysaccharide O-acyltransferase-like enzyme [Cupriavidus plantarum]
MDRRIDGLRVLACLMVVLLHVSSSHIHEFGPKWWSANVWDGLSRACVPLFFMLSGSTLLGRSESLTDFFRKRALRILPPLLLWSCFYLWWLWHNNAPTGNWLLAILRGPTMFHLWYFYAIAGLYLFMPVMRRFYQYSTQQEKIFFLVTWFLVASVYPTVQSLYTDVQCGRAGLLGDVYQLQYFGGYLGYLVLGAYLAERRIAWQKGAALFAVSSVGTILLTYWLSKRLGMPCEFFHLYLTPLVVLAAAGAFIAFLGQPAAPSSAGLQWLSGCTLGVYGLHPFVIDRLLISRGWMNSTGWVWIDPLIGTAAVFLVSLAVIGAIRLIKPLRWMV